MARSDKPLEELDVWLAEGRAETVTEIDLSCSELRAFPEQVLRFRKLESLSLAGNDIGELPEEIAQLASLRKLDLSRCGIASLPDGLGALARLEELRLASFGAPLDEDAGDDDDDVAEARAVPFPRSVLRLRSLVRLDLSMACVADLPDGLLELGRLEELRLGGVLGHAEELPDLSRLPRLRSLHLDGRTGHAPRPPAHDVLAAIWPISTLEDLVIARWGEATRYDRRKRKEVVVRPALTELPADAFARMPGLRRLDLSYNELETLPESFYALGALAEVRLVLTNLDRPTVERLRRTLPDARLDLRQVQTRFDLDEPSYEEVSAILKKGTRKLSSDPERALALFERALSLCDSSTRFSEHDRLHALSGAVEALSCIGADAIGDERGAHGKKLRTYAERALGMCAQPGTVKHLTDEAVLQEEATRVCGNALAWRLMEDARGDGDLDRALTLVNRALAFAREHSHDTVRDTQVRILLRLGREEDAFAVVHEVLARDPHFDDFQDIAEDPAFHAWQRRSGL